MSDLDEIQAELTALTKTLEVIDKDHGNGTLSDSFYYKRRVSLVRDQEITLKKLMKILEENGAKEVAAVVDKVATGAPDDEIKEELNNTEQAGEDKSWGSAFKTAINEKKGSIVQVALGAALKVAKFILL